LDLAFQEVSYVIHHLYLYEGRGLQMATFKKLPEGTSLFCRYLKLGAARIGFAVDKSQRKLYLDLNDNQDLTDDPGGVFIAGGSSPDLVFSNVVFSLKTANNWRWLGDLTFHGSWQPPAVQLHLRSFYQGRLPFNGKDWQVGLVKSSTSEWDASIQSRLLLRPWESRSQSFSFNNGLPETIALPKELFFLETLFQVKVPPNSANADRLALELHPRPAPRLGELHLTGSYLHRLILENGLTVLLDDPVSPVKIPVGTYPQHQAWLRHGNANAFNTDRYLPGPALRIEEVKPATLFAGGPLTNRVQVSRQGTVMRLSYQLVGAGNAQYAMAGEDRRKPPQFMIYHQDRKVHFGQFEFG
jgi:hypothetical protein